MVKNLPAMWEIGFDPRVGPGRKSLSWWHSSDIRLLGRLLINLPSFHSVGYTSAKCREKGGHFIPKLVCRQ